MKDIIFVIDDDPHILGLLKTFLTTSGYEVDTVSDGEQALTQFIPGKYAVVLTDICLPGIDGYEVIRRIRQQDDFVEVIVLTGFGTLEGAVRVLREYRAYDFMAKPLDSLEDLRRNVVKAIERRRLRKDRDSLIKALEKAKQDLERRVAQRTAQLAKANSQLRMELSVRQYVEKELMDARIDAENANQAKSRFLANVSHEIRTPVSGIIGAVKLLEKMRLSQEAMEIVQMIKTSAYSQLHIINDILDFSKIEAGRFELSTVDFDPSELISNLVKPIRLQALRKGLGFRIQIAPDVPKRVHGDPGRIGQVLRNIVDNAVKFTEHGHVEVSMDCRPARGGHFDLCFSVSDTGIGIPAGKRGEIFETFCQLSSSYSKKFPGTGLGLAISKRIVEMMGGRIQVQSSYGKGSQFQFNVITAPPVSSDQHVGNEMKLKPDGTSKIPRLKVLLAEDERLNRIFIRSCLESGGHEVVTASNGFEVIDILKQEPFDLILMDIQMPDMDGIETTRRIRQGLEDGIDPDIPIIALTAFALEGDKERMIAAGMDDYLSKPVEETDLFSVMERVLDHSSGTNKDLPALPDEEKPGTSISDLNAFISKYQSNKYFLAAMLNSASEDFPERLHEIELALDAGDLAATASAAHKMAGITGAMKIQRLRTLAIRLEQCAKARDNHQALELFYDLKKEMDLLMAYLPGVINMESAEIETPSLE